LVHVRRETETVRSEKMSVKMVRSGGEW
jgi:hypothetical protein